MAVISETSREYVPVNNTNNGFGFFLGILLLIVFVFLLFYYGLPYIRGNSTSPQIQVPNEFDINVRQQK